MCCLLSNLMKFILVAVNLIFVLGSIGLVGIGIASLINLSDILEIIPGNINAIPITIIVLGCVIFAISFCGCWGAIKESKCLLFMYTVCMAVLAGGKIYLTTVIFSGLSDIQETVEKWVTEAFDLANNEPFHLLEIAFRCCGTIGPDSYLGPLPASCCPELAHSSTQCTVEEAFTDGCVERLGSYFQTYGDAIGGVLIAIIIFELLAASVALFICCTAKKGRR